MKLSNWIEEVGGRVKAAELLGVTTSSVHYWLTGQATPEFKVMFKIHDLSKGRVKPSDIITETKARERYNKERTLHAHARSK